MKAKTVLFLLVPIGALAYTGARAVSDDQPPEGMKMPSQEEMMEGMKLWLKTIQPGEGHERLNRFVGTWDVVCKMPAYPGAPSTKGKAVVKWVLDKRFLMEEFDGQMMMPDLKNPMDVQPRPYQGLGLIGYDNFRKIYNGVWASSGQTNMIIYSGNVDPSGRTYTYYGTMDEPMLGVIARHVKYVTTVAGDDKHTLSIYDLHAGENYKVLEFEYTRSK